MVGEVPYFYPRCDPQRKVKRLRVFAILRCFREAGFQRSTLNDRVSPGSAECGIMEV